MAVSHIHPHLYVRNGVTYKCMKVMANTMLDFMIKEEGGKVNLRMLAQFHNLVPYSDNRILEANAEDIKLSISAVLRPVCKAMCLKSKERELVRQMILKVGLVFGDYIAKYFSPRAMVTRHLDLSGPDQVGRPADGAGQV